MQLMPSQRYCIFHVRICMCARAHACTHNVIVCEYIRMLDGILASLPKEVAENLKSQDFWPIFSRHSRVWIIPLVYIILIEVCT